MAEGLHLSPRHREKIEALVRAHLPDVEVWAYGSRVNGRSHDGSDLDMVLRGPKLAEIDASRLAEFTEALHNSTIPFLVEARDWTRLPERFHREIERHHVVLVTGGDRRLAGQRSGVGSEWREVRLGDLIDIKHGFAFKGHCIHDEPRGDVLLTPGNFDMGGGFKGDKFKYYDGSVPKEFVLREGDLLVTMTDLSKQSDTLGYPAFVPACTDSRRYLHNQRLGKVSLNETAKVDTRYIYYVMCGIEYRHEVLASATGTTVKHTSPDRIKRFRFPLPPLPEQRAIAHILGTLDDKIELNRRMNETLEAMARALFKSWFVDFDPVRAKMEGRDTGLPKEIADLFPARLVDSELGEIPEGWEVATVGDHIVNFDAKRIPVSGTVRAERRGSYPYHGAAGVLDHVDDYIFDGVFLLLGEDGSVMRENGLAVTQYVWGKFWVNNHAHVLQGAGPVSTEQAYLHFSFEPVAPLVTGAVQPKLSQNRMNCVPFVFAGEGICRAFTRVVQPWFARLRSCAEETKILAALRDALLPRLVSGELRVGELESLIYGQDARPRS